MTKENLCCRNSSDLNSYDVVDLYLKTEIKIRIDYRWCFRHKWVKMFTKDEIASELEVFLIL